MILHGNARGGAKDLARHLLKDENDHVTLHDMRGFMADDLEGAFNEAYAVSRGTKARKFLFSLSLNPPANENVSTEAFEDAIRRVEHKLGLEGQPRAIVFHEKNARRHAHAVWSRIDGEAMKAIPLPFSKRKLMEVSRDLYFEHGWQMPDGFLNKDGRDPYNFTHAQWQQAKRTGQNPNAIKSDLRDCWAASPGSRALQANLEAKGYALAKGDRRAVVVIDRYCEVYSLPRWLGLKTKEVKAKLGEELDLPTTQDAKTKIAERMAQQLATLKAQRSAAIDARLEKLQQEKQALKQRHQAERAKLADTQSKRGQEELAVRQARYRKGFGGLWDHLTDRHRDIKAQNERETYATTKRDRQERDAQIFGQLEQSRRLQGRIQRLEHYDQTHHGQTLINDLKQYREIHLSKRDTFQRHARGVTRGIER